MPADLVLRSDRLLWPDGRLAPGAVTVQGERIAAVTAEPPPGVNAEDLGELVLMPALVDAHVHINEPGRTEWEGFETATKAAAAGGIATLVDMPLNSIPVTTSVEALRAKVAAAAGKLWVDVGFWGGVVPGNARELSPMVDAGALGFKCFLCHSGIDDFPKSEAADLREAMPILRHRGVPLLVHAELESELPAALAAADPREYLTYLHSRPKEWEDRAIAMMIDLCRETRCRVHIVHLSSATALPMIRKAKAEGLPLTVETCPHYLCLTAEEVPRGDTAWKCAPPIREDANRAALWAAVADGTIDTIISDHSPCVPSLKLPELGDFLAAWGGIASLQLGLANIHTEALRRGHSLPDVHRWMAQGPVKQLGWEGSRGALKPGFRADLVAFDPSAEWEIRPEALLHRHPVTPYAGKRVIGAVRHTWVRGHRVVENGIVCDHPVGRCVHGGE
jgi:allantoinase